MKLNKDLIWRIHKFLNKHERAYIMGLPCPICHEYIHWELLDQDVDQSIKNYCLVDSNFIVKQISNTAQRIHVIGNHWVLVNHLKHRKFKPFATYFLPYSKPDSYDYLITDNTSHISKYPGKMVITQGYKLKISFKDLDFLVVEKGYISSFLSVNKLPLIDDHILRFLIISIKDSEIHKMYKIKIKN